MSKPLFIFRKDPAFKDEFQDCAEVVGSDNCVYATQYTRDQIQKASVIVLRYCANPFYDETYCAFTKGMGSELLSHPHDFRFITSMNYLDKISGLTPKSYWVNQGYHTIPNCDQGWVLRSTERSIKWKWDTHMRARTREDLPLIMERLRDSGMDSATILAREYIPLKTFEIGINGLPFTNEWRCFFLRGEIIASGFYWGVMENPQKGPAPEEALSLAHQVCTKIDPYGEGFFAIDVAEKQEGGWICVEVNTGEQSGLSCIDSKDFYRSLIKSL